MPARKKINEKMRASTATPCPYCEYEMRRGSPALTATGKVGQQATRVGPNSLRGFWHTSPLPRNPILHLESFHHAVESATTSHAVPRRWFADAGSTL